MTQLKVLKMIDVSGLRRSYSHGGLSESDLTSDPIDLFERWLKEAIDAGLYDPNGMVVSTVNAQGRTETWTNAVRNYAMLHVTYRFHILPKKKAADN